MLISSSYSVCQTLGEVQKSEYVKKGIEMTSEFTKTAGKAGETILEQGKKLGQSTPLKTVSEVKLLQFSTSVHKYDSTFCVFCTFSTPEN